MKRRKRLQLFIDISVRFAPQLSALSSWHEYAYFLVFRILSVSPASYRAQ
jgi:hypothetical protein